MSVFLWCLVVMLIYVYALIKLSQSRVVWLEYLPYIVSLVDFLQFE